jgi:hypothetical protein
MYRAIGDSSSWRDGVFSHASPSQPYQASSSQYGDGTLGAVSFDPRRRQTRGGGSRGRATGHRHGGLLLPRLTPPRPIAGMGEYFQSMSGLGHVYQDGVLGADSTTITVGPSGASIGPTPTPPPPVPFFKTPGGLAFIGIGIAGILYFALHK